MILIKTREDNINKCAFYLCVTYFHCVVKNMLNAVIICQHNNKNNNSISITFVYSSNHLLAFNLLLLNARAAAARLSYLIPSSCLAAPSSIYIFSPNIRSISSPTISKTSQFRLPNSVSVTSSMALNPNIFLARQLHLQHPVLDMFCILPSNTCKPNQSTL